MLRCSSDAVGSSKARIRLASRSVVETLESRQLPSAALLSISTVAVAGGTQLQISGTAGSDKITVTQTASGLVVSNTGWSQTLAGSYQSIMIRSGAGNDSVVVDSSVHIDTTIFAGNGNDTLQAGSGNDTLFAGTGKDVLRAGSGNDTLVSFGAKSALLYGGAGQDSFWADNSSTVRILDVRSDEQAYGAVHRVSNFFGASNSARGGKAKTTAGRKVALPPALPEPAVDSSGIVYQDFSSHLLFSAAGPSPDDIVQGQLGDCYFLATLSSVARTDPMKIRQSILNLGDGTYLVQLNHDGQNVFVHVDGSLPTLWANEPAYADFGTEGSLWVAIMEKAWTYVRGGPATYAGIDSGWMDEAFKALGSTPSDTYSASNEIGLLSLIQSQLNSGKAVTYAAGTPTSDAPLLANHAYSVVGVVANSSGTPTAMVLRNPWGFDGAGNDSNPNDGYVTVTAAQAFGSLLGVVSASV